MDNGHEATGNWEDFLQSAGTLSLLTAGGIILKRSEQAKDCCCRLARWMRRGRCHWGWPPTMLRLGLPPTSRSGVVWCVKVTLTNPKGRLEKRSPKETQGWSHCNERYSPKGQGDLPRDLLRRQLFSLGPEDLSQLLKLSKSWGKRKELYWSSKCTKLTRPNGRRSNGPPMLRQLGPSKWTMVQWTAYVT